MKKIILFLIAFSLIGQSFVFSQKVLDKSGKRPDWVNGLVKDYIIVTASGSTVESAQSNALLKIKERIITSVAENVQTSSDYYRGEKSVDGVSNFIENFETSTKTKSADISYLKGISLNKAEEYYWEKVKEANNDIKFYYHIKYPFSEMELAKLVIDFDMADKQLTEEMSELLDSIDKLSTIEQINQYSMSLQKLSKAFIDQRKEKANIGIIKLSEMLKSIVIYPLETKLGEIHYTLKLGEKIITTAQKPRVTSTCAKIIETLNNQTEWVIRYDYSGCYDDPANSVNVSYSVSPNMKQNFAFDINADKANIFLKGLVNFNAGTIEGNVVKGAKCRMTVVSKYQSPVLIEKITITWDKFPPVVIDNFNKQIEGKGEHEIVFQIDVPLDKVKCSSSTSAMITGNIQYNSIAGVKATYQIYNQDISTDW